MQKFILLSMALLLVILLNSSSYAKTTPMIAKVSLSHTGEIQLNGKNVSFKKLTNYLQLIKNNKGIVWYYRENPEAKPSARALRFFESLISMELPIRLSSSPDFTDFVDSRGMSHKSENRLAE